MSKLAVVLIVTSLSLAVRPEDDLHLVRRWVRAARQHHPGTVDKPLLDISVEPPRTYDLLRRMLTGVLRADFDRFDDRNDVLRRGALLHMDIALLLPRQAAEFTLDDLPPPMDPYSGRPVRRRDSGALGHVNEARASLERAAKMYPAAQSPLLALSDLDRAAGNRAEALQALQRLEKLPARGERQPAASLETGGSGSGGGFRGTRSSCARRSRTTSGGCSPRSTRRFRAEKRR